MDQFTKMHVEFWRDGNGANARNVFCLRAELPRDPELDTVNRYDGSKSNPGLGYIWFILNQKELQEWARNSYCQFTDGTHRMDTTGDRSMFYDAVVYQPSVARKKFGVCSLPYYSAEIPQFFRKMLLSMGNRIWTGLEEAGRDLSENQRRDQPRVVISFDQQYRNRITKLYGKGKGRVTIKYNDYRSTQMVKNGKTGELVPAPNAAEAVEMSLAESARNCGKDRFKERLDQLIQISRNSTYGHHETSTLGLSIDGMDYDTGDVRGYYFTCLTPDNKRTMVGGLIFHSHWDQDRRLDTGEWSIHT